AFREAIRRDLEHARQLGARIESTPQLQLMAPIELSAVCFRYASKPGADANGDAVNLEILKRVNQRGRVYLSNALLHGKFGLRACIVNHRTTDADVAEVVSEVLAAAAEVCDRPRAGT